MKTLQQHYQFVFTGMNNFSLNHSFVENQLLKTVRLRHDKSFIVITEIIYQTSFLKSCHKVYTTSKKKSIGHSNMKISILMNDHSDEVLPKAILDKFRLWTCQERADGAMEMNIWREKLSEKHWPSLVIETERNSTDRYGEEGQARSL